MEVLAFGLVVEVLGLCEVVGFCVEGWNVNQLSYFYLLFLY